MGYPSPKELNRKSRRKVALHGPPKAAGTTPSSIAHAPSQHSANADLAERHPR